MLVITRAMEKGYGKNPRKGTKLYYVMLYYMHLKLKKG
jgi:hypothetical protein